MKYHYEKSVTVTVPIPENYQDCIILLQSDYYRSHGSKAGVWRMYLYAFCETSFVPFLVLLVSSKSMVVALC